MTNKICDLCSSKIKKGDKIKDIEIDDTDILYFHSKCLTIKFLELLDDSFELSEMRKRLEEVEEFMEESKKVLGIDSTVEKSENKKWKNILEDDTELQDLQEVLHKADEVLKATN